MPLDLARIQALCFDVDGTLRDTDDQFVLRLAALLRPAGFLFPRRDPRPFARWVVMKTETPGSILFGIPDRLHFDDKLARVGDWIYQTGIGRAPQPFLIIQGVAELLAQLRPHYPLAVVSARGRRSTQAFLDQFSLGEYFHCIATAQTCRFSKPYPDPILWAAGQMGVAPENCLMIGDTTVDIRAGKAAGAQTVGVLCGFGEEAELRAAGADLILPTPCSLMQVLLGRSAGVFPAESASSQS